MIAFFRNELLITIVALSMNLFFLINIHVFTQNNGSYYPETPVSLAYSFYRDNAINNYTARVVYKNGIKVTIDRLNQNIPISEAQAYALLMGGLWKLTGSLKYYDIQILQMLLFAWSCLLLYWGLCYALNNKQKAFFMTLGVPFFFPLLFLNSNPVRDVFCFYGSAILFYIVCAMLFAKKVSNVKIVFAGVFIAFCQWMRQTLFGSLGAVSVFLLCYGFFIDKKKMSHIGILLSLLWITNIIFFWVTWTVTNKKLHGRYFAAQSGQLLLDSMGYTGPNKINSQCTDTDRGLYCDSCVTQYTVNRFNLDTNKIKMGTPEMDDKMKEAFWEWFWQDPVFWFKGFFWRIKKVLWLDMTWSTTPGWNWEYYNSFSKPFMRIKAAYSFGWRALLEFMMRRWYVRIIMLLGYLGAFMLLYERNFLFLGLLISLVAGGISPAILSHPEHRYLTPFYFIYPLCAGYFLFLFFVGMYYKAYYSYKRYFTLQVRL